MSDEPLPDSQRAIRGRVHLFVILMLAVYWIMAFLSGHSAGYDAYEASEKAAAVAIAGLAGMSVYFLIRMPTNMNDSTMALGMIPMGGLLRVGPKVVPESFSQFLAIALLANLMGAVVAGCLVRFFPSTNAAKSLTSSTLGHRRRELEVKPVRSSVVRSYLEAGLTERGREESP